MPDNVRKIVARLRSLSDRAARGEDPDPDHRALADVFVLEDYRGRGLSKWLMETILAHPDLQAVRRWHLVTRDAQGLYARFGFGEPPAGRHMERVRPNPYGATP